MTQPGRRHRRWRGWGRVRAVHRRLWTFLALAFGLGAAAGVALTVAQGTPGAAPWCLGIGAFLALWPLAWLATFRIARPLVRLAHVARRLQGGQLQDRGALAPADDDEVGQVAGALRGMADRLAQQLERQKALMAAVSHELRSPLARVRVLVELAREGRAPAALHDTLQAEIDGMDALVGDLLAASRIDFEAVARRALDLQEVATRALDAAGLPADALRLDRTGLVEADPTLLTRALRGLLDNALRHGAPPVILDVTHHDDRVRFAVLDGGPGFSPGDEARAFEPFWRGEGPRPAGQGLGLALVQQIAEAHGGTVEAGNRPEGGARVALVLPVPRSDDDA